MNAFVISYSLRQGVSTSVPLSCPDLAWTAFLVVSDLENGDKSQCWHDTGSFTCEKQQKGTEDTEQHLVLDFHAYRGIGIHKRVMRCTKQYGYRSGRAKLKRTTIDISKHYSISLSVYF